SPVREQQLRDELEIGPKKTDRYHRLAAGMFRCLVPLGPSSTLRPSSTVEAIEPVLGLQPGRPLVVGRITDRGAVYIGRLLMDSRDYWRALGMPVQIVLINDDVGSDAVDLHEELTRAIAASRHGKEDVVLGHADRLTPDQQIAVQALARLWITGDRAELLR